MGVIRINRRFRGPPESGNGGYVAGLVAAALGGSNCTVRLNAPPPLDEDLSLEARATTANLLFGDEVIVRAVSEPVRIAVPPPPSFDEAKASEPLFAGHVSHYFPGCFVCGPERENGDGMRIFPGKLHDPHRQVAATWTPDSGLGDGRGNVRPEFLWAALDCPGYFAADVGDAMALLGEMSATVHRPVKIGEPLVVTGWPIERDGRKHVVGCAIHDRENGLVAAARATWIIVGDPTAG